MLSYKLDGKILHVTETILSFTTTKKSYWRYDTENWVKNANGKFDEPLTVKMDQGSIDWVKKNYFPKVGLQT
jgi:hypothetical protein